MNIFRKIYNDYKKLRTPDPDFKSSFFWQLIISIEKFLYKKGFFLIRTIPFFEGKEGRLLSASTFANEIDYIRISMLELCAYEITRKKIPGNVAELGVYRGDFAKIIGEAFPDKKLYLFDSFEGFSDHDLKHDKEMNLVNIERKMDHLAETSIDLILDKMPNPNNCIIKKGYFPKSATGIKDRFCFVSLGSVDISK